MGKEEITELEKGRKPPTAPIKPNQTEERGRTPPREPVKPPQK
jgi:hypothetical protein